MNNILSKQISGNRFIVLTFLTLCFWFVIIFYLFLAIVKATPISMPYQQIAQRLALVVLPQGWGFFTKDPKSEEFYILKNNAGVWSNSFSGPAAEMRNYFGFSRYPRAQGVEYGLLSQQLKTSDWRTCESEISTCLKINKSVVRVRNMSSYPIYCGNLSFYLKRTIPYAWRTFSKTNMPAKYVVVDVICK